MDLTAFTLTELRYVVADPGHFGRAAGVIPTLAAFIRARAPRAARVVEPAIETSAP